MPISDWISDVCFSDPPAVTAHHTVIEIIGTLVPVVILVLIAIPSIGLLQAQYKPAPDNAITLKAIGNQWVWIYEYPDNGDLQITANMLKEKIQVPAGDRYRTDSDVTRLLAAHNPLLLPVLRQPPPPTTPPP